MGKEFVNGDWHIKALLPNERLNFKGARRFRNGDKLMVRVIGNDKPEKHVVELVEEKENTTENAIETKLTTTGKMSDEVSNDSQSKTRQRRFSRKRSRARSRDRSRARTTRDADDRRDR